MKEQAKKLIMTAEEDLQAVFADIDAVEQVNFERVMRAFSDERVSARHFAPTTGYGYDDLGRDTLDKVFSRAYFCEDALVRPQIASGTHAIYTCLDGLATGKDNIVFATDEPYDTLKSAIAHEASFQSKGTSCRYVPLIDGRIDVKAVLALVDASTSMVYVQRSRGYSWRNAILPEDMEELFTAVHTINPGIFTVVDNCYGEFTCITEPSLHGADVLVGSLIKNAGGGLAPTGGYIAGTARAIAKIENRLTVPGMGREVGSYAASYLPFYQGLFFAPHVTAQTLKSAALFARVFELLGIETLPSFDSRRSDIVQELKFPCEEDLVSFCCGIQRAAPVDSFVTPVPWDMPGYENKVVMAAGTFVQGASVELSADAPIREPFIAYVQGALTYAHGRLAATFAAEELMKQRKKD